MSLSQYHAAGNQTRREQMSEAILERSAAAETTVHAGVKPAKTDALRHILTIANEKWPAISLRRLPSFIVIFLLLSGFLTFMASNFFERGQANLLTFFAWHPWLYLFLVPGGRDADVVGGTPPWDDRALC